MFLKADLSQENANISSHLKAVTCLSNCYGHDFKIYLFYS